MTEVRALSVNFILFPVFTRTASANDIFAAVFGREPDETQTNRTPTPQKNFLSTASTIGPKCARGVRVRPGRIDVSIEAPEPSEDGTGVPTIDALGSLEELLTGIGSFPDIGSEYIRAAIICTTLEHVKSQDDANWRIAELCGLGGDTSGLLDLSLQMNRRTKISSEIELNRIIAYSVMQAQTGQFRIVHGEMKPTENVTTMYGVTCKLDFNTVPGDYSFSYEGLFPLFSDISELLQGSLLDLRASSVLSVAGNHD